ncbi:MAG: glycosyltransferase family 2 protein [Bdellovibrionales bacterium]|nr:glycosyltransferase family 2 protein [Bdellovibrionales bacterium]
MESRRQNFRLVRPKSSREITPGRVAISVVVPVYNEESNLGPLYERLSRVLAKIGTYEILFVDDGSTDNSASIMRELSAEDDRVGACFFSRNFGHEAATSCGLHHASGQTVAIIDADLQDPPQVLLEMYEQWKHGYDVVYGQRRSRKNEPLSVRLTSFLFYYAFRALSKVNMPVNTGDFRLMDEKVVKSFKQFPERNRYVRGLTFWSGYRQKAVIFDRDKRFSGRTKYNFFKRASLAFDAICGISGAPLRLATLAGFTTTLFSLFIAAHVIYAKLIHNIPFPGYALLTSGLFCIGGVQLFTLGLLGEYVGRIYREVQQRPLYVLKEHLGPKYSDDTLEKAGEQ